MELVMLLSSYRRGRENLNADALSRAPVGEAPPNEDCLGVSVFSVDGNTSLDKLVQASSVVVCPRIIGRRSETKIKEIIDFVESELLPTDERKACKISLQPSQFVISYTILYLLDTHRGYRKRAIVPEALQVELLLAMVDVSQAISLVNRCTISLDTGPVSKLMYNTLASSFWWEGMYKDTYTRILQEMPSVCYSFW